MCTEHFLAISNEMNLNMRINLSLYWSNCSIRVLVSVERAHQSIMTSRDGFRHHLLGMYATVYLN